MQVNITALRSTDADAPVIKLNNHKQLSINITLAMAERFTNGNLENNHTNPTYIKPKCIPDIAMMCTTPVLL